MHGTLAIEIQHKTMSKILWVKQVDSKLLLIVPLFDTNKNWYQLFVWHNILEE